jgi:hypothetical protein
MKERRKIYLEKNKEKVKDYKKNYYNKNREYFYDWEKNKRKTDPIFKLSGNLRKRINSFVKLKNINKNNKTFELVGCSPEFLKEYLEKKFTENMSWENYGDWHIDHIIPLSSSKTEEEVYNLCHYTNLQPLWAHENLSKGSKILNYDCLRPSELNMYQLPSQSLNSIQAPLSATISSNSSSIFPMSGLIVT